MMHDRDRCMIDVITHWLHKMTISQIAAKVNISKIKEEVYENKTNLNPGLRMLKRNSRLGWNQCYWFSRRRIWSLMSDLYLHHPLL